MNETGGHTPADPAERRAKLSPAKRALLESLIARAGGAEPVPERIPPRPEHSGIPLSFAQQRLWFLQRLDPASAAYTIPMAFRFEGDLDVPALERAFGELIRRHEVLRTTFPVSGDEPVQVICSPAPVSLETVDLSSSGSQEAERRAIAYAEEDGGTPLDIERGPLLRLRLFRLAPREHILVLTIHHIIFDGWSLGVLLGELAGLYGAFAEGREPVPAPPRPQFGDYALWQRTRIRGDLLKRQIGYWTSALEGAKGILDLPRDVAPAAGTGRPGGEHRLALSPEIAGGLQRVSRDQGATMFMTLAAAFGTLLARISGEEDLLLATPVAGRSHSELEQVIGFFVNTVVVRVDLRGDPTFAELLSRVRASSLGAFAHQDVPFERLVEEIRPVRLEDRSPLVQVMFVLQNLPGGLPAFHRLAVTGVEVPHGTAKFDLTLTVLERETGGLEASFEYDRSMFTGAGAGLLAARFDALLQGIVRDPASRLSALPLMTREEALRLPALWNPHTIPPRDGPDVLELIDRAAGFQPESPALTCGRERLTYRELSEQANRLARRLMAEGVGPDTAVGICMRRSSGMIVAMLGIMKAGGAYVPLDPAYPPERTAAMIREARVRIVLTTSDMEAMVSASGARPFCTDREAESVRLMSSDSPGVAAEAGRIAYIMFTSGSTGTPKGVEVSRGALAGHSGVCRAAYGTGSGDRVLQFASLSFDPSVEQIFTALTSGAHLVIRGEEVWSAAELCDMVFEAGLTVVNLPTAYWQEIARELPARDPQGRRHMLRLVIAGGEAMSPGALSQWRRTLFGGVRLLNAYGPTETTVTALLYDCGEIRDEEIPSLARVPIGRPLPNRWVCVLDRSGAPAPPGVPGELYIGGRALARGYVNNPGATAERFVPNHIDSAGGSLLYRTGDIVRAGGDGVIEFLGRGDDQAKVRGYRVEPGEIASLMKEHPAVDDAVAVVRSGTGGTARIVAYAVPRGGAQLDTEDLRRFLKRRLPPHLVPGAVIPIGRIPLMPNGKVDRAALPAPPEPGGDPAREYVPPRDGLEARLVHLWESLLGKKPIGVFDDFFDLGGHSLLAARLFAQIEKISGKRLPLSTLFHAPTIDGLASLVREGRTGAGWSSLVAIKPAGNRPPLYCVHAAGGNVLTYQTLAARLHPDQPVYGLQARGLDGVEVPLTSVEEMAELYVREIRAMQPEGPYFLGGACTGGIVAFEIAQQLVAAGQRVGLLAMFDTFAYGHLKSLPRSEFRRFRWESRLERARYHAGNLLLRPGRLAYIREKSRTIRRRAGTRVWEILIRWYARKSHPIPRALAKVEQYNVLAIRNYLPRPYPGRITLFPPGTRSVGEFQDRQQGWGTLALGGVEIHDVLGDHMTMLEEPFVHIVADRLSECLDRARAEAAASD